MTNERVIQILEILISTLGDVIIVGEYKEALEMAIRSLQQEQPSEDLEKEIEKFLASEDSTSYDNAGTYKVSFKDPIKIARHFYELGKQSKEPVSEDLEEAAENYIAPIENDEGLDYINFNGRDIKDAFKTGAEWQKEQMLKDAVEAEVHYFGETQGVPRSITIPRMQEWLKPFKDGDKVKIVIVPIKED